jgi:hypothetical protein
MSKKGQSKNDLKNLTYIPQKPAFLQNFGQPKRPSPPPGRSGAKREGRGDLPSRPSDGEWAEGSDAEKEDGSDDEWGETFGGGGDEGPQVVVLKEGRHLTAEDVKRERRRGTSFVHPNLNFTYNIRANMIAAGKKSTSPPPREEKKEDSTIETSKPKSQLPPRTQSSAKRKLVTKDTEASTPSASGTGKDGSGKKKKKGDKKLLSFGDDE